MKAVQRFCTLAIISALLISLTAATAFADRVVIRENNERHNKIKRPTYNNYERPIRPVSTYRRPSTIASNPAVNVDVDVNVNVEAPTTPTYAWPYYYPTFAYDYFIIDYPQDDRFIYRTFPASMGYFY